MSQPNNNNFPPFSLNINGNINDSFFDSQPAQVNNAPFSQWPPQATRPMEKVPSPSVSVRTAMTAPNPRPYPLPTMNRPNMYHPDKIDPNLSLLAPPQTARPRSVDNSMEVFSRMYRMSDEPWSTVHLRTSSIAAGRGPNSQPNMQYPYFRSDGPGSDHSGAPRSDSGYITQQAQSVISTELEHVDQELPSELFQVGNIHVDSASSEQTEVFPRLQSDQTSQYSGRSTNHGKATFPCSKCREISKCPSDFKKHMLKHDKPHACDIPGCRRAAAGKGFTTVNDLQRHKKSVHRIGVEKDSYQCASEHCRNKGKIWPRLDNFKQHINRMHKGEDEQDLIHRSVYKERYNPADVLSVAPMDTTLAGIGTEKQFAGNELDDPVSGISLTPDQDTSQWTQLDPSSQGFAMDVDRTSTNDNSQDSPNSEESPGLRFASQQSPLVLTSSNGVRDRQNSLNVLASAAAIQVSPEQADVPRRQLSSAPQTKAEQQRQALQKFSKALYGEFQSARSAEDVDLENVVLRVLYGVTNQNQKQFPPGHDVQGPSDNQQAMRVPDIDIVMTKQEALKASQAISNLIKQSGGSPLTSRPRRSSKGFSSNKLKCERCDATLNRSCDMKKHMKRHTRPYGCTYPKCHKRFGAKSDWKRHENSQHFQLESYRCQQTCPSSQTPCGELFYRAEAFKTHLKSEHKMGQDPIQHELKARKIGKNGQGQFWCGFCQSIVRLKEKRSAAWDERFDHIDNHFSKEKRGIEDWLCVEAKKTKGEVLREMDRTNFGEDNEYDAPGDTDESPPATGEETNEMPLPERVAAPAAAPIPSSSSIHSSGLGLRKRPKPMDGLAPHYKNKQPKIEVNRFCCSCEQGPLSMMYVDCFNCGHHLCSNCTTQPAYFDEG